MKEVFLKLLSQYIPLTPDLEAALAQNMIIREYRRGTILLHQGDKCNMCYFLLKGLMRRYYLKGGVELTTAFFTEGQAVTPSCYGTETPSDHCLDCLEDCVVCIGTPQLEQEMLQKHPSLEALSRVIGERMMAQTSDTFDHFKMNSPEQRYLNLIQNEPGLTQRVAQRHLASYLGMTPESLSRIRKRLTQMKKPRIS